MKLRENFSMKTLAFIAAVAAFTTTAIMGWYQLANFDALWSDGYTMSSGYTRKYLVQQDYHMVKVLVELKDRQMAGAELSLSDRRGIERLEAELDAGATNLRWQLLDQDGQIIYGNTQEDSAQADIDFGWTSAGGRASSGTWTPGGGTMTSTICPVPSTPGITTASATIKTGGI